jgi:hypothetical protein
MRSTFAARLATRLEIDTLIQELYAFADDPRTVAGLVRVIQTWGAGQRFYRPLSLFISART